MRYDDIYRMDEIKSLSFHIMFYRLFRGVTKYIVYCNTFSTFEWLRSLYAAHHGAWRGDRGGGNAPFSLVCQIAIKTPEEEEEEEGETEAGGDENDQPGHYEELVPKRGTTSVAWTRVFKHCSFKTTDFKPLKLKQQTYMCAPSNTSYMRAPSLSMWEEHAFFLSCRLWTIT